MKPRKIVHVAAYVTSDGERVYAVADDGSLWKGRVVFDSEIDPPDWGWRWDAIRPLPPIEEPEGEERTCHCLAPQGDTCSFCTSCNKPT